MRICAETTVGDNLADIWNRKPARVEAPFARHRRVVSQLKALAVVIGFDDLTKALGESFGHRPTIKALEKINEGVNDACKAGTPAMLPPTGLIVAPPALSVGVTPECANTFLGAQCRHQAVPPASPVRLRLGRGEIHRSPPVA